MSATEIREVADNEAPTPATGSDATQSPRSTNSSNSSNAGSEWQAWQVYVMASVCLVVGILFGYLVRGSARTASVPATQQSASAPASQQPQQMPSLDDMKRMADKQAEPLLAKLKADPNNADLLNQVGTIYRATHQFPAAADYYKKSLDVNPKNVGARIDLASCLYYQGDVDSAIAQLEQSLTYDPKHPGALLNLGLIRWKGKGDATGAIKAWQTLLKLNPKFENKAAIEKLISEAKNHTGKALPTE